MNELCFHSSQHQNPSKNDIQQLGYQTQLCNLHLLFGRELWIRYPWLRSLWSVPYGLVGFLYTSRAHSNWQWSSWGRKRIYSLQIAIKSHLPSHNIHTSTPQYARTCITITSSRFSGLPGFIFSRFLFSRSPINPRKSRKFAPSENFPLYGMQPESPC